MTSTDVPSRPDPTRTGAVWVTGTGAFLLLAAAAVFTAVRWDQIPEAAKLGVLGLATGAFLIAGRGLKATLPATAGALFHLGAFLVPIDVAAIGVHADLGWPGLLLAEGLTATITFGWAALIERSVILRWSFAAAVVALVAGVGATTDLPAPLMLAGLSLVALQWHRGGLVIAWAGLAGVSPLLTFIERAGFAGSGTVEQLGLTGPQPRVTAVLTGVLAATALGIVGRRRNDVGLALMGALVAATGIAASGTGIERDPSDTLVGMAVIFLAVEAGALAARHDVFWRRPANIVARLVELAAGFATGVVAAAVSLVPFLDGTDGRVALAVAVLGLGWVAVEVRTGTGRSASTLGVAVSVVGTVAMATGSPTAVALTLVATAVTAALLPTLSGPQAPTSAARGDAVPASGVGGPPRPGAHLVATIASVGAPLMAVHASVAVLVITGIAGSLIVAETAVRRSRTETRDGLGTDVTEQWAWLLSALALVPGGLAMAGYVEQTGHTAAALIGGAALATAVAALADRGRVTGDLPLGTLPRVGAVAVLAATTNLQPTQLGLVALAVAGLSIGDALRLRDPHVALGASVAVPVAIHALSRSNELSMAASGVALAIGAAVLAGLGSLLDRRWAVPVLAAVALSGLSGLSLAAAEPAAFAHAWIVITGIALAASVERGRLDGVFLSGLAMTAGIWLRLAERDVTASEPYLLPVAILLLGAGLRARSIGTSSWIAYGPVIALLGGAALAERFAGGPGWHGLVAGVVGVLAVAAGGHRRLAAPLFCGTGLLVALVGYETLAITAELPTWTWLAVGGTVLLGAGVAMERHDLGPIETGRRLVDVVDEHFA